MRSLGFITNVMFIERYWVSISKMELVKPLQIKYFHFLLCHIRQQSNSPYEFFLLTNFSSSYPRKGLPSIFTVRKQSCGKVRFSQASVKNSVHRGRCTSPRQTPLGRHTPPSRHPPWADIPLGRHPPPMRRLVQRTVRILLECIFVSNRSTETYLHRRYLSRKLLDRK